FVAAGTADRQAAEGGADGVELVVHFVIAVLLYFALGDLRRVHAGRQEAGRLDRQVIVRLVLIAGDLPFDELVERQILVERRDDEIAIVIRGGPIVIVLEAVAFGEASQVEPVPAPAFAIVRTGEQLGNHLLPGR